MDLNLSEEQAAMSDAVGGILSRQSGGDLTRSSDVVDRDLLAALHDGGYLDLVEYASAIEATLVVELAAAAPAPIAARALVGPLLGIRDLPLEVALCDSSSNGLTRYGTHAEVFLVLDGDEAGVARRDDCEIEPVDTRYAYPLARVRPIRVERLEGGAGRRLRAAWSLALGAELSGNMLAALSLTSEYVTHRHQFGRAIGSFQAIQHRLATCYVKAEGARWLTRRAAATPDDEYLTACAATFACVAAQETYTATHQSSGAIGLTTEHNLVAHTMRLVALQRELGGKRNHARRAATTRPDSPNATPRLHSLVARAEREAALDARR